MNAAVRIALIVLFIGVARASAAEPVRVACVGDSITAGWGIPNPALNSYPAQLKAMLGSGYQVGNFGHSGATLTRATDRPYWSQAEFTRARKFKPQIVVIMLGTNDAHPARWDKVKDDFVPTLKEMVGAFRELESHPRVFVCLPVPSFDTRKANIETAVVPLVRQACREAAVPVIDLFHPLEGRDALFPDRLHPDAAGSGLMAAVVHHAISDPVARKKNWRVKSVDSEESGEGPAVNAIDGRADTYWHTAYSKSTPKHPHELVIDLDAVQRVFGVSFLQRQIGVNGRVRDYELLTTTDPSGVAVQASKGRLTERSDEEYVFFKQPIDARYLTFRALSEVNGGPWTSLAELDVLTAPSTIVTQSPSTQPATTQASSPRDECQK